jgi:hypothetical protein
VSIKNRMAYGPAYFRGTLPGFRRGYLHRLKTPGARVGKDDPGLRQGHQQNEAGGGGRPARGGD